MIRVIHNFTGLTEGLVRYKVHEAVTIQLVVYCHKYMAVKVVNKNHNQWLKVTSKVIRCFLLLLLFLRVLQHLGVQSQEIHLVA